MSRYIDAEKFETSVMARFPTKLAKDVIKLIREYPSIDVEIQEPLQSVAPDKHGLADK